MLRKNRAHIHSIAGSSFGYLALPRTQFLHLSSGVMVELSCQGSV